MKFDQAYLIWSNEHRAWWAPNEKGYTPHIQMAGLYTRDRALKICLHAVPGRGGDEKPLPEILVRLDDAMAVEFPAREGL